MDQRPSKGHSLFVGVIKKVGNKVVSLRPYYLAHYRWVEPIAQRFCLRGLGGHGLDDWRERALPGRMNTGRVGLHRLYHADCERRADERPETAHSVRRGQLLSN